MVAKKSASTEKAATPKNKPVKTTAKKTTRKKATPKKPIVTPEMHEKWFFNLDSKEFKSYAKEWNETKLKIKIPKHEGYDQWLNYFKTLTPSAIRQLADTGLDFLPIEAYAALSWWHDVIKSPYRMDKIHKAGLTTGGEKDAPKKTISQLARDNDRLGVLKAIRDSLAEKLDKGAGNRDTASLAQQMTEIMTQIADYEKRQGPKKETRLGQLLGEYDASKVKKPKDVRGARKTSFKAKVTIKDLESVNQRDIESANREVESGA